MLRRILVPLDGSPFAEKALPAARALARRTGCEVQLLHVLEMPPVFVYPEHRSADRVWAEGYLAKVAAHATEPGVRPFATAVREGRVTDEIHAAARAWEADLLVLSTHGRGGLSRLWMGSVADRCLRTSERPVLLVHAQADAGADGADLDVRRVVVPLDGSELAETALPHAALFAKVFGVPVQLLRGVVHTGGIEFDDLPETAEASQRMLDEARREAASYLDGKSAELVREGVEASALVLTEPGTAQAIADRAAGDLIVMTTHGRGGPERTLFGSVADKVVRSTLAPVVVIPPARRPSQP